MSIYGKSEECYCGFWWVGLDWADQSGLISFSSSRMCMQVDHLLHTAFFFHLPEVTRLTPRSQFQA